MAWAKSSHADRRWRVQWAKKFGWDLLACYIESSKISFACGSVKIEIDWSADGRVLNIHMCQ